MIKIATVIQRVRHVLVWLNRIGHCRGFGIQSPTDYWLVRYVFNEHWPYYQYELLGDDDDWLTRKLGLLYFRIANWRQPHVIESDSFMQYLQAGCRDAKFSDSVELIRLRLVGDCRSRLAAIYNKVVDDTVLIVEAIEQNRTLWHDIVADERARVTFDLYYCGIVLFDKKRHKMNYIINF